jgi:hypothetical protein
MSLRRSPVQGDHRQAKQHDQPPANAEPPTKYPMQTARTPARPSVIEVIHKTVSSMINSVDATRKPPPADWHRE